MNGTPKLRIVSATLLALACTMGAVWANAAYGASTSSECVNCHTNLAEMDRYGAAAAGGAAEIAG